jgi:hypothetical protein
MPGDTWMEKMLRVMCESVPQTDENRNLYGKIALAAGHRCNGLDYRKIGLLAADAVRIAQAKAGE